MKLRWKEQTRAQKLAIIASGALFGCVLLGIVTFVIFCMDNLMHSDMSAEVLLSKLLSDQNRLITKDWYYSTEIRIVYTQLIMAPLFKLMHSYQLVKQTSVFICLILLAYAFVFLMKRFDTKLPVMLFGLALLFAPVSNEYFDMQLVGNFYTAQTVCTFMVLTFFLGKREGKRKVIVHYVAACVWGIVMGLSGLRYPASLYVPMVLAAFLYLSEKETLLSELRQDVKRALAAMEIGIYALVSLMGAGIGFLIHKFYLAPNYSFDTKVVRFVPLDEVPERFLQSIKLMLAFVGYREADVMTPMGVVNVLGFLFLLFLVTVVVCLFRKRKMLSDKERILLYYFLATFSINWYLLVFTDVLLQYRYWLPVYIVAILLVCIYFSKTDIGGALAKVLGIMLTGLVILGSLYAELLQDMKYNDCEKRYAYMAFLEQNDYDFGYASFWNASVSEYLSNGEIKFASLGLNDFTKPYDWLLPKAYYEEGFHRGKCFLLLANTEAAGMDKGDFVIMEDAVKVYTDEFYTIYEGQQDMYILDEE